MCRHQGLLCSRTQLQSLPRNRADKKKRGGGGGSQRAFYSKFLTGKCMKSSSTRKEVFRQAHLAYRSLLSGGDCEDTGYGSKQQLKRDGYAATIAHRHGGVGFPAEKRQRCYGKTVSLRGFQPALADIAHNHKAPDFLSGRALFGVSSPFFG